MAEIIWSPQALADLDAICQYIGHDSSRYAERFAQRCFDRVELLAHSPRAGSIVKEFKDPAIREVVAGNYRILYRVVGQEVHIGAIHHGARRLQTPPAEPTP